MKCKECGGETGSDLLDRCYDCYKMLKRMMKKLLLVLMISSSTCYGYDWEEGIIDSLVGVTTAAMCHYWVFPVLKVITKEIQLRCQEQENKQELRRRKIINQG